MTIRFFSEEIGILPRGANFVDIPLFVMLSFAALLLPRDVRRLASHHAFLGIMVIAFLALSTLSVVVNINRVIPAAVVVFLYGFLAPIGVYAATYALWPIGNARYLLRLIIALGSVQFVVVALLDYPRFAVTKDPDQISGTFGTNAYQMVYFLVVVIALSVATYALKADSLTAKLAPITILGAFVVIWLAQYRTLLVALAIGLLAVALLLGSSIRAILTVALAIIGFGMSFYYVAHYFPQLKLDSAATSLANSPAAYVSGRLGVIKRVTQMYAEMPMTIVLGSGPGTYSSRAWQTFAYSDSTSISNVQGGYALALTGGKTYSTDVSAKFVEPQIAQGKITQGSRAISTPYSSYASVMAELGIFGLTWLLILYLNILKRCWNLARSAITQTPAGDAVAPLAIAAAVAFLTLIQMAVFDNWYEVTRITFITWILLAVVVKETRARREN